MGSSSNFHEILVAQVTIQLHAGAEDVIFFHRHAPDDSAMNLDRTRVFAAFEK